MANVLGHVRILVLTLALSGKPDLMKMTEVAALRKMPKGTEFADFKLSFHG